MTITRKHCFRWLLYFSPHLSVWCLHISFIYSLIEARRHPTESLQSAKLTSDSILFSYAVLAGSRLRSCPRIECENPECKGSAFCYKCHAAWGPNERDHVCKGSTNHIAANNVEVGGSSSSGEFFPDNHRSLLSRLQHLFRLPTADATVSRRKPEDIESGSDGGAIASRNFSTTAMPVQARGPEVNTEDEIEEDVPQDKG